MSPSSAQANGPDLADLYAGSLTDLGDAVSSEFRNIYRDPQAFDPAMLGVTEQFTTKAGEYSAKFDNVASYSTKLNDAFAAIGWTDFASPRTILDIGVGSGSSTAVLLRMFPHSTVVACDISAQMLQLTRDRLARHQGMLERCFTIQMDSEKLLFEDESFDFVVGAANLHHLFRPDQTIQQCGTILKTGGYALFFDPFEAGNAILGIACRQLAAKMRTVRDKSLFGRISGLLGGRVGRNRLIAFLENCADVWKLMAQGDKTGAEFKQLDDKWLFTAAFFRSAASKAGFSQTWVYPLHDVDTPFESQMRYLLEQNDHLDESMPSWGWDVFAQYDRTFSSDLKKELLIEGAVILGK